MKKRYAYILLLLFFIAVPLFQSLIFSSNTGGAIYINKEIDTPYIKSEKKNILIYFGYVGCADICTPFLSQLSRLYESEEFKTLKEDTDVFFINLTPNITPDQPDLFAKFFNKNFKGIYLSKREVLNIDKNFGLFFSEDLQDATELNHTDYLYLVQTKSDTKLLKSIYFTHPLRSEKLIDDMINHD